MTLKEFFAAHAIAPIYADLARNNYEDVDFETIARLSFSLAEQMIEQSGGQGKMQFAGWANLYSDGDIGIIHKNEEELQSREGAQVIKVYYVHDRTDEAL